MYGACLTPELATPRRDVDLNGSSGLGQLELADPFQIHALTGEPRIMSVLHGKPALGAAADGPGQAKRHFGSDPATTSENAAESRRRYVQLARELAPLMPLGPR